MAGKMSPKFVTLCSLAVGAIYSTGYSITTSHNTAAAAPAVQAHASAPSTGTKGQNGANGSSNSSQNGDTGKKANTSQSSKKSTSDKSSSSSGQSTSSSSNSSKSSSKKSSSNSTKSSQKKTNTSAQYLDGTYNGAASNRIGRVAVAVSIKGGKIANVQITQCETHYPESYINPVLPNYVVAHQTTRIPIVSGATLSTRDFYFAVVQALSQAKNPNYKG